MAAVRRKKEESSSLDDFANALAEANNENEVSAQDLRPAWYLARY